MNVRPHSRHLARCAPLMAWPFLRKCSLPQWQHSWTTVAESISQHRQAQPACNKELNTTRFPYGRGVPKRTPDLRACDHAQKNTNSRLPCPRTSAEGSGERKFFDSRKEAQAFASDLQVQRDNFGTRLLPMPESLREEALDCAERLKPLQATLSEAVTFYLQHRQNALKSCTVSELVRKVLVAKASANRSKRVLDRSAVDLRRLCQSARGTDGLGDQRRWTWKPG